MESGRGGGTARAARVRPPLLPSEIRGLNSSCVQHQIYLNLQISQTTNKNSLLFFDGKLQLILCITVLIMLYSAGVVCVAPCPKKMLSAQDV